jgi:AAA+ ATPase superfamily predicted ATPase
MMQGLVLDSDAPLYGRAVENIRLRELPPFWLLKAFKWLDETDAVRLYSVVGGIPYYWELVKASGIKSIDDIADQLLIDPHGPLHDEPQRLLLEESPPAAALRPVLDAIGGGAHRLSEIAGRIGQPSTALGHPIKRLIEIGLIKRDLPFNESEKNSKRTLYSIADPFCRIWFSIIAPHRGALLNLPKPARIALFKQASARLYSETWEELCRNAVPCISDIKETVTEGIMWGEAKRWWHGEEPEWDIVAESINGKYLLLGEAKWGVSDANFIRKAVEGVSVRKLPNVKNIDKYDIIRAVFVPRRPTGFKPAKNVSVLDAGDILRCMENSKASGV